MDRRILSTSSCYSPLAAAFSAFLSSSIQQSSAPLHAFLFFFFSSATAPLYVFDSVGYNQFKYVVPFPQLPH